MKKIILILIFFPLISQARIAVLIHGYLSSAQAWQISGINAHLIQAGWQSAGILNPMSTNTHWVLPKLTGQDIFYAVDLPSLAPAWVQAELLQKALNRLRQNYPDQSLILIAHSAGGVVARLNLVRFGAAQIQALITIASPHLGTDKAIKALDAVDDSGWFGWMKEWFVRQSIGNGLYNILQASRGILWDLAPPKPGNLLFWLNGQPHPNIHYVSVIRTSPFAILDQIVPPFSQDMNNVPALSGRSSRYFSAQGHELNPMDGILIVNLLNHLNK